MPSTLGGLSLIGIDDGASGGDIVTIVVGTSLGRISIMGEVELEGRALEVKRAHIQSEAGPNAFGIAALRKIASFVLTQVDCDEARVEGAARTTGAHPGRSPRAVRFSR